MSANLKTANLASTILRHKIVVDTTLDQVAISDITQGAGTLNAIMYDATGTQNNQVLKLSFTTSDITVGTTVPDVMFFIPPNTKSQILFPSGMSFTSLSAWLVMDFDTSSNTNTEAAANRNTAVRFVTQ
jgi:hypothetical protein|tara:strand:- start:601 stop:987 length:387 start_codon:yes stop_codon:yes gene_type:complete